MSFGISLNPRAEQSTTVPSQEHPFGHALSIKQSPAKRVRNSSTPIRLDDNRKELKKKYIFFRIITIQYKDYSGKNICNCQ